MKDLMNCGFVALDAKDQCCIVGGGAKFGALSDTLSRVFRNLSKKMGTVGAIALLLADNADSFIEGVIDGWNR